MFNLFIPYPLSLISHCLCLFLEIFSSLSQLLFLLFFFISLTSLLFSSPDDSATP